MRDPYGAGKPKVTLKRPRATATAPTPTRAFASPRVVLAPPPAQTKPRLTFNDVWKMSEQERLHKFGFVGASQVDKALQESYAQMHPQASVSKPKPELPGDAVMKARYGKDTKLRSTPAYPGEKPVGVMSVPRSAAHPDGFMYAYRHTPTQPMSQDDAFWAVMSRELGPEVMAQLEAQGRPVRILHQVLGDVTGIPALANALKGTVGAIGRGDVAGTVGQGALAGVNLGMMLPFGRFLRGGEEAVRAGKAAAELARGAGAGRDEVVKAAMSAMKNRIFKVNNLEVAIPAAGSRTGAAAENLADAARGVTARAGFKNEAERAGSEYAVTQRNRMKTLTNAAQTLRKIGKHLDDTQQYTLRILGEGVNPLDRIALHEGQIADATAHGSLDEAAYHGVHSSLLQKATEKYIDISPDGVPTLKPSAPAHLHEAWSLLQEVSQQRENLYRDLGLLNDKQIMERIQAPGRVTQGARYIPAMDEITQRLEASPGRQLLQHAVAAYHPEDVAAQGAIMRMADSMALVQAEKSGDPMAVEHFYEQLHDVVYHDRLQGNEGGMLFQSDPMMQAGAVQVRMLMDNGLSADEAISKTAAAFGLQENELRSVALGAQGEAEMSRILSNADVGAGPAATTEDANTILTRAEQQQKNDVAAGRDLEGLPEVGGVKWRSNAEAQQIAEKYMTDHGMPYEPPRTYAHVDRDRAERIAEWYDEAQHAPTDPAVKSAYDAMIRETLDQYKAITDAGYTFEFYPEADPYPGGPREAMVDLRDNKHLYVFPTDQGFGTEAATLEHPLLQQVPVDWGTGNITANDLFRAVHDFFGHFKEGVGFRADGEENAWRAHSAMYSEEARKAMTSETRGQNSWVNFGPHGEANRTASQLDTVYADQKAVLAPEWVVKDGAGDALPPQSNGPSVLYQGVEDFGDAARNEIESHRAFARDIKSVLPESEWPAWVKNMDKPPMRPVDMTPVEPRRLEVRALPDETPEELASRQAAVDQDYMIRHREWEDQVARRKAMEDQWQAEDSARAGDTFPEEWLPQRAYSDPYGAGIDMPGAYKGAIQFTPQGAILHLTERTDTSTFVHEMAHFARRYVVNEDMPGYGTLAKEVGLKVTNEAERAAARRARQPVPRIVWSEWDTAAEEKFARMFESWVRTGRAPQSFSRTASVLSHRLRDVYEHSDLPDVKPEVASFFEKLVSPKERRGGRLVGAEDFNSGVAYIPYARGIPQSRSALTDTTAAYFRRAQSALFGGSDRAAIGAGPQDKALKKAFKGNLLLHGNFKINVTDASAESLMVAARLSAARQARADLLKAASDVPSLPSDIAIKVDPSKDAPPELSAFFDKLHDLDSEGKLDSKAFEGIDLNLSDALREALMPSTIDGVPLEKAASEAIASNQPIDNIKWIPRDFLDKTMLRGTRASNQAWMDGLNKVAKVAIQGGGITFDAMNDIAKAVLLYMNPAYAPVNLAGNLVMNMMQQGPFMAINLWKSVFLHRDLNVRERVFLDSMMGHGVVTSLITQGKVHPASIAHNTIGRLLNLAVDLIPRRSAFLHEARKLGFDTPAKLKMLLDDTDHSEEMLRIRDYISRRANDAIVDYDRMSPLDKAVINRVIFFYPWIKGATRYTNRFLVEHPYQAMALAVMADHAYHAANEQIGDRPDFLKETFPLSTQALGVRIPFTGLDIGADSVLGKHTWTDSEGHPMTINVRQAFTMTTSVDMATSFASFVMGDPAGAGDLVQMLTPVPYSAGVALYGKDPFKRRDVPQGFGTFLNQMFGAPPIKVDIQRITLSEKARRERNKTALYPRSKGNEEAHVFGGGLTPTPVNTVTAAGLAAATSGDTYKQQVLKLTQDAKANGVQPPPPEVLDDLKWRGKLSKAEKRNSPYSEKLQAAAQLYAERTGDKSILGDVKDITNEAQARDYYYRIRDILFANYNRYYTFLSHAKQVNGG